MDSLSLDYHGPGEHLVTMSNVAHPQADQISATQFAVNSLIEHGALPEDYCRVNGHRLKICT